MFVRFKNLSTGNEVNLNSRNIVMFEPAGDPANSTIHLTNGTSLTVDASNRAVRFAIKKAQASVGITDEPAEPGQG